MVSPASSPSLFADGPASLSLAVVWGSLGLLWLFKFDNIHTEMAITAGNLCCVCTFPTTTNLTLICRRSKRSKQYLETQVQCRYARNAPYALNTAFRCMLNFAQCFKCATIPSNHTLGESWLADSLIKIRSLIWFSCFRIPNLSPLFPVAGTYACQGKNIKFWYPWSF